MSNIPAISIAVFENTKRKHDKAPIRNVVIEVNEDITLRDGTFLPRGLKLEGGLWGAKAKSGMTYERGSVGDPYQPQGGSRPVARSAPAARSEEPRRSDLDEGVDF